MTEETAELTCQRCERSYVSEGDEEDRCPFCEASQHDCDICTVGLRGLLGGPC